MSQKDIAKLAKLFTADEIKTMIAAREKQKQSTVKSAKPIPTIVKQKKMVTIQGKKEKPLIETLNLSNYTRQVNTFNTKSFKKDLKVAEIRKTFGSRLFHTDVKFTFTITYHRDGQRAWTTPPIQRVTTFQIPAKTEAEARNEVPQRVVDRLQLEENPEYQTFKLISIDNVKVIEQDQVIKHANYKIKKERMKEAFPIKFSWINSVEVDNNGQCVYNALQALKKAPKLFQKKDKLLKFFQDYEDQQAADEQREAVKLTLDSGVSPEMMQALCEKHDITHYCLDIDKKVVFKHVTTSANYEPICYITHSSHMYLITDKTFVNKLSFTRTNTNNILGMFSGEEKDDCTGALDPDSIIYNPKLDDLEEVEGDTIIMATGNLQDVLIELYKKDGTIYEHTCKNGKVNKIKYNDNVTILADPNVDAQIYLEAENNVEDRKLITWKDIAELCKKNGVPFTNQSFPALVMQIVSNNVKPKRVQLKKEAKMEVKKRQENKCNICRMKLQGPEFDHIVPLASGGTNALDNIQALCKSCHFSKSKDEEENGEYFSLESSVSTFNNTVDKIVHGDNFKRYAFIEKISKAPEGAKLYYIDLNKCRKNILYHLSDLGSQIPVFTCMDEPEKFDVDDEIQVGFYWIESNNYFHFDVTDGILIQWLNIVWKVK